MTVEIKIARYELYPTDEPTSFCVGFQVSVNSRSMYQDTQVSLENAKDKTEDEIVSIAFVQIEESISAWIENAKSKPSVLGTTFTPPVSTGNIN